MARKKNQGEQPHSTPPLTQPLRGLREGALLLSAVVVLYLWASLATYSAEDPAWNFAGTNIGYHNSGGVMGAWFADILLTLLGLTAWLIPPVLGGLLWGVVVDRGRIFRFEPQMLLIRVAGLFFALLGGSGLSYLHFHRFDSSYPARTGGVVGEWFGDTLVAVIGGFGATALLLVLLMTGLSLLTHLSWLWLAEQLGGGVLMLWGRVRALPRRIEDEIEGEKAKASREKGVAEARNRRSKRKSPPLKIEPSLGTIEISERASKEPQISLLDSLESERESDGAVADPLSPPPLSLLNPAQPQQGGYSHETLKTLSALVEQKLLEFGVEVEVVAVQPGPVITRFELTPAPGVRASRITGLSSDLARSLALQSVRVVEVIPGKSTIGLEIPNENREIVYLSEILSSQQYERSRGALSLALGKDISGQPEVADLTRMPHLLVAGTTGSGKSVSVNTMILSLLFKYTADYVRLIMIDPKMLELSIYEGIPHLLAPVVTDMDEAASALRWSVAEMDRRYKLMSAISVRSISAYNSKVKGASESGEPLLDPLWNEDGGETPPVLSPLPYIVVVVDELADLMLQVGKKVEEPIIRLAQKARAAQRPSADVITGLIKTNIPSRIAFQVSSRTDSRVILDQNGAETLLGRGDMLYMPISAGGIPARVHCAFVEDDEVVRVVDHLRSAGAPAYDEGVLTTPDGGEQGGGEGGGLSDAEQDPLYDDAVRIVTESRNGSASNIQRRLSVGYNRAARMVEAMQMAGVLSPPGSNGQREVLAPAPVEVE